MKYPALLLLLMGSVFAWSLTPDQYRFCKDHEQWNIIANHLDELEANFAHSASVRDSAMADFYYDLLNLYYTTADDTLAQARLLMTNADLRGDINSACSLATWLASDPKMEQALGTQWNQLAAKRFRRDDEQAALALAAKNLPDSLRIPAGRELLFRYGDANAALAGWAKEWVDDIAVEPNDSLRLQQIDKFMQVPHSIWRTTLLSWRWAAMLTRSRDNELISAVLVELKDRKTSPTMRYILVRQLLDPTFRDHMRPLEKGYAIADSAFWLSEADRQLALLEKSLQRDGTYGFGYDRWTRDYFLNKCAILEARLALERFVSAKVPGDKEALSLALAYDALKFVKYDNNDAGEIAELWYWRAKLLEKLPNQQLRAADAYTRCLVAGAPRKRFDVPALTALTALTTLHDQLQITTDVMTWARALLDYHGPVFEDATVAAGLNDRHESRVAWGDYDNDGYADLLLNGDRLFHNLKNGKFADVSDSLGVATYSAGGGLWADFDRDGRLDYMTLSHDRNGNGEKLMRQLATGHFAAVNERAGDIDDHNPTEGAAWFDMDNDGWPELYCACYETPGTFTGNPDLLWKNDRGYFRNFSKGSGIRTRYNNEKINQCGRGVAPADYDNDGQQELLVTNYRLDRNFLFDLRDGRYEDIAGQEALQGHEAQGCYGHSIGADWGDFDNDGDLDLFVANLAHPRYIAFSNKSFLFRNDGPDSRTIDGQTIRYTQFTDITKQAGIQYDELHSDPLWFDCDNDGDLDLFITSIYENERTYLYLNNGDGTFTDVTFLAGARVYNGWGNAAADYDHDGFLDVCVGSGSGVHLLHNVSHNGNVSCEFRLWLDGDGAHAAKISAGSPASPNTPPLGARIELVSRDASGVLHTRMRELCSAKGTTSQNDQVLHFGIGHEALERATLYYRGEKVEDIPLR